MFKQRIFSILEVAPRTVFHRLDMNEDVSSFRTAAPTSRDRAYLHLSAFSRKGSAMFVELTHSSMEDISLGCGTLLLSMGVDWCVEKRASPIT